MFLTFFYKAVVLLYRYGKMFSLYSFFIIMLMSIGFIARAVIYNQSLVTYGDYLFVRLATKDSEERKAFVSFQQSMLTTSIINWVLNMVYDIIVLKMYSVYSAFQAATLEESINQARRIDRFIKLFCFVYFLLGVGINLESFLYLKDKIIEDDNTVSDSVTMIGVCLFCVDMMMLMFYYFTIIIIIRYYTKDNKVNTCQVWMAVHLVALTYTIEMIWSDLFMFGSYFNNDDVYFMHSKDSEISY